MSFRASTLLICVIAPVASGQTLQEFSPVKRGEAAQLIVFASGNAKSVVAQPKDATTATGSLGMTFIGNNFIVGGVVNIPAKGDTVMSGYGASMLAPAAGTRTSALLDIRLANATRATGCDGASTYRCRIGVHTYFGASGTRWGTPAAETTPARVDDVASWSAAIGPSFVFFDGFVGGSPTDSGSRASMGLDVMFAARTLRGDLGMAADSVRRRELIDTNARQFGGAEVGLSIRYNEAMAGLTYYHMGGSVRGFSGGQVVAGISFRARLNGGSFRER